MNYLLLFIGSLVASTPQWQSIPNTPSSWSLLSYSKSKTHKLAFNDNKMTINVNKSSGPLIHTFKKPKKISRLQFSATIEGALKLPSQQQGLKGADDFVLRVGLIYAGKRTMNFFERQLAPDWLVQLSRRAPKGVGIKQVEFFNVYSDARLKKVKSRKHPLSELLIENFVVQQQGPIVEQSIEINSKNKVLGIWIGTDGDDTNSSFKVTIKEIKYTP